MPKLCGLSLSNYIAFFVVFHVIGALELKAPPLAISSRTVFISWTSNSSDPLTFNIILNCSDKATVILKSSVLTSSQNVTADIPSSINGQNSLFLLCELQARKSNNFIVLDQVPIEVETPFTTILPSLTVPSGLVRTSASLPTTDSTDTSPSDSTDTSPSEQSSTASSTQTSTPPIGAIIGGVVGGLVGLGILAIFVVLCLRRRRRLSSTPLLPIPLPYDQNYVQPLEKNDYLARIADEREAVRQQRDQLQTEVERIGTSETSESGLLEHKMEALSRRILELEAQQQVFARQLHDGQSPPSYSNLSSAL